MGSNLISIFDRARSFLAGRGFARNLRLADVLAAREYVSDVPQNLYWHSYRDEGGSPGPLDAEGNMPSSSAAFILATLAFFDGDGVASDVLSSDLMAMAASGQHVVRVAGTDVLTVQLGRELVVPGQMFADDSTGNRHGTAQGTRVVVEPTPPLYVGAGERVQQATLLTKSVSVSTCNVRLGLTLLVADQGTD